MKKDELLKRQNEEDNAILFKLDIQKFAGDNDDDLPPSGNGDDDLPPNGNGDDDLPPSGNDNDDDDKRKSNGLDIDFSDDDVITVDTFKPLYEELGFEPNEQVEQAINEYANQGFSAKAIEYLIRKGHKQYSEGPAMEEEEIRNNLKANLNNEEKRDFKFVGNMVGEFIDDPKIQKEAMSNPILVKVFHKMYRKYVVGSGSAPTSTPKDTPKQISFEDALDSYKAEVAKQTSSGRKPDYEALEALKQELIGRCSEPKELEEIFY